jgi:translation initiation factor 4A
MSKTTESPDMSSLTSTTTTTTTPTTASTTASTSSPTSTQNDLEKTDVTDRTFTGEIQEYETFDEMDLKLNLLRGIYAHGFEKPSPIQSRAIIPILSGTDTIGQAQSGTGKTGTFLISALQRIDESLKRPQIMILGPTRELAEQIYKVLNDLNTFMDVSSMLLIGGNSRRDDIKMLEESPKQILVGTPGRMYDMLKNLSISSKDLKMFILDEADEMLSRGFQDQIYEVFQYIPKTCQVVLMSATMPPEALEITDKFMDNPIKILVKNEQLTLEGIKQFYVGIDKELWKLDTLKDIYGKLVITQSIIYCNTKKTADWLVKQLTDEDFAVKCIHSAMESADRRAVMEEFREGILRVIVATDLISRGIDVQQVNIVINYDIPRFKDVYIHRIGRSGRFGRKGVAINFVTQDDIKKLRMIQEYYQTEIEQMPADISEYF